MQRLMKLWRRWSRIFVRQGMLIFLFGIFLALTMSSIGYAELSLDKQKVKNVKSSDVEDDKRSKEGASHISSWIMEVPTLDVSHDSGDSDGEVHVEVEDPSQLTGHDYQVNFHWSATEEDYVWELYDLTASTSLLSDQLQDGTPHSVDGFSITVTSPFGVRAVVQVADQDGPLTDDEMDDAGRPYGGNNVWLDESSPNDVNGQFIISRQMEHIGDLSSRHDYEIRFSSDSSWAKFVYGNYLKISFQVWDIGEGTPDNPTDDEQMIIRLYKDIGTPDTLDIPNGDATDEYLDYPCSDRIYFCYVDVGGLTYEDVEIACDAGQFADADTMWGQNIPTPLRRLVIADHSLVDDPGNPGQKLFPATGTVVRFLSNTFNTEVDTFSFNAGGPQMWASAWELDFGEVAIGDSLTKQVVLENIGSTVLDITGIDHPSYYHLSVETASIPVGDDMTLEVTFCPVDSNYNQSGELCIHATDRDYFIDVYGYAIWDGDYRKLDVNSIGMWVQGTGLFASHPITGGNGLEWPEGTMKNAVYSAGLWLAGDVEGDVRTACVRYDTEYQPGMILPGGAADDPDLPKYHVYKINRSDYGTSGVNPDYDEWPSADGAPVDDYGEPLFYGDQQVWYVMNDLVTWRVFQKSPIGIEVQTLFWGYDSAGALGNMIFGKWRLIHKGTETLNNCYVGLFSDPDIGGAYDDYTGCDSLLSFGYAYNGDDDDDVYGSTTPAVGFALLSSSMTSYVKFINNGPDNMRDPHSADEAYHYLQGLDLYGDPFIDPTTSLPSVYVNSGDPVTSTGWLASAEGPPADVRMVPSTGPFTLAPGDTHEVIAAIIVGQGTDYLNSVTVARSYVAKAKEIYQNNFWIGQSHFTPVDPTGRTQPVYITDATLYEVQLQAGDEIGVFDGTLCVGTATVTSFPMADPIVVYLEYTPPGESTLPGAQDGNDMLFKVWDRSADREEDAKILEVVTGTPVFAEGAIVAVRLDAPSEITQEITIQNGKLNLISFNVIPESPDASAVFDGVTNFVVAFNDDGEYRIPPDIVFPGHPGTNTIGDVDPCDGYSIFISGDTPHVLSVYGLPIYTPNLVCTVDHEKLNKTAFPKQTTQPIADVFNATANPDLWPYFVVAFDDEGQYFIPPDIVFPGHPGTNTIGDMLPGKGYSLYHSGDAPINYTFPEGTGSPPPSMARTDQPVDAEPDHFKSAPTGEPHAVFLLNEGLDLEKGDELAVYAGAHCVGAMKYAGSLDDPLVIWQAVPEYGLTGIEKGDSLIIRLWHHQTDKVEEVPVEGDISFDGNRYFSVLTLQGSSTPEGINRMPGVVPEKMALYPNYPNPFNPETTIRFDVSTPSDVTLVIYNIQGRVVTTLVDTPMAAGQYEVVWDGCGDLGNRVGSGVYFIHLKAGKFSFTRKLLLVQ